MAFDLIIGIDLGMSGTGVVYHQPGIAPRPTETEDVTCLFWGSDSPIEKVPTRLAYERDSHRREPISWGIHVPTDGNGVLIKEWFKTEFGAADADQTQVERLFLDYLTRLYTELSGRFTRDVLRGKPWADANVSFQFSAPSIWDSALVGHFKELVEAAGFGQAQNVVHGRGVHTVDVSLVEPQATAALHLCSKTSSVRFKNGQCVMVVDAGAGTGDFSLLKIGRDERGASRLDEKSPVHGGRIGSSYIDRELQSRIAEILEPHSHLLNCEVGKVAWIMRCSREFQEAKRQFGTDEPQKEIPVPHLKDPESSLGDRIQNGMLIGIQNDLRIAFDKQVDKIQLRIRDLMRNWHTGDRLDYLLLSGGLGSSAYVQEKLKDFCTRYDSLKATEVIVSHRPRMAVSMGLVYDAMSNRALLAEICCRTSFGLVFRMPNDSSIASKWRHKLRELKQGGWLRNQDRLASGIDWFIKEGAKKINGEEVTHPCTASFKVNAPRECEVQIVASSRRDPSPSEKADRTENHPQRRVLMQIDLSHSEPMKKYTTWRKESYVTIAFSVKATIRPAEVNFRCVDSKGKVVSDAVSFPADGGHNMRPLLMGLGENEE